MVYILSGRNVLFGLLASLALVISFAAGVVAAVPFDPTPGI